MRLPRLLLAGLLALAPMAHATEAGNAAARVDALLSGFGHDSPGVAIGVVRDGDLVFSRSAGMANLSFDIAFTVQTPTNIGSTAKQFTGFAVALLQQRGALSLDDDVRKHLPELPDFGEPVTLRHLASHTSGYREFLNGLVLTGVRLEKGDWIEPDEAIALVKRQPELQNAPGEEWNYNNTGYLLLARVIEQVTGESFADWMAAEVFTALGMRHTLVRQAPDRIVRGASTGYSKGEGGWVEARDVGSALGAGGVYTTVPDMARWMRQLGRFELGGDEVREWMVTPFTLNDGKPSNYGLGLIIDSWRGLERWQHGGGDIGHLSLFHYFPQLGGGVMVFANHHEVDHGIVDELAEIFFGEHLESREAPAADPATALAGEVFEDALFDHYAGRYALEAAPDFVLRFFRDGERYMTQATGQPAIEITPLSADTFAIVGVDARVTFETGAQGQVEALTLFQHGEHRAVRLPEEDPAPAPDLDQFAGRYFSEELETFYVIEVADDGLALRHRRFGPLGLHHAGNDSFRGGFPVYTVDFLRDEEGRVTGLHAGNMRTRDVLFVRVD